MNTRLVVMQNPFNTDEPEYILEVSQKDYKQMVAEGKIKCDECGDALIECKKTCEECDTKLNCETKHDHYCC